MRKANQRITGVFISFVLCLGLQVLLEGQALCCMFNITTLLVFTCFNLLSWGCLWKLIGRWVVCPKFTQFCKRQFPPEKADATCDTFTAISGPLFWSAVPLVQVACAWIPAVSCSRLQRVLLLHPQIALPWNSSQILCFLEKVSALDPATALMWGLQGLWFTPGWVRSLFLCCSLPLCFVP